MKKNVIEEYSKQVEEVRAYYDRNDNIFKIMRLDKETAHSRGCLTATLLTGWATAFCALC